ncbi:MAG: plastocyanin [Cyanobacteria bacterium J06642_2]
MSFVLSSLKRAGALFAALALVVTSLALTARPAAAETYTVKMGSDQGALVFDPASITIKSGDTIKWVNNKAFPHNVVFDTKDTAIADKLSSKKLMASPTSSHEVTFDVPAGEYSYFCTPHRGAGMAGKVIVQ